ncbi:spermidine/putrescine-binding periplasmic protein [Bifidobacterium goeldii]|uniref:Spermidine/putrescine-binding periplasmic protein n=1 Tax=Bifidobacterium goeldii TaxID=2306975 RepID=A0A430FNF1_9BIFI|nr:extracellular solute-binding protein [Bifidobacterium goeldii]RSX54358.1 spermidine/putrescine-binding periplasmic protein [Bifidobacterium goeldii]
MKIKSAIAFLAASALVLTASACGSAGSTVSSSSSAKTTVSVIGFPGLFAQQFEELVIKPYEKANPNVTIKYTEKKTSAESIGQVVAAKNRQTYDIAIVDKSAQGDANKQGVFSKVSADDAPNINDLVDTAKSEDGYGPSVYIDSLALIYNKDTVKNAPSKWEDLWNPEYKGQVVMSINNAFGLSLIAGLAHDNGDDYTKSIDKEIDQLKQLKGGQVQSFSPTPDVYTSVASGAAQVGLGWYARAKSFADENTNVGVVVPKNGGVALTPTINLVEGAPNKKEALKFLNYAIGSEAQSALAKKGYYGPVSSKVTLSDDELSKTAAIDGGVLEGGVVPDWNYIATVTTDWLQVIKQEITS